MCPSFYTISALKGFVRIRVSESCSAVSDSLPTRLLCPWNSPGKNTAVGKPFPSPRDLLDPGIEPRSPALQADSLLSKPPPVLQGKPLLTVSMPHILLSALHKLWQLIFTTDIKRQHSDVNPMCWGGNFNFIIYQQCDLGHII